MAAASHPPGSPHAGTPDHAPGPGSHQHTGLRVHPHARVIDDAGVVALLDEVGRRLRANDERMTGPRRAVLVALARHGGHLLASEVVEAVAATDPTVHRASVYRALEALSQLGVVQHLHLGHGGTAYHLTRSDAAHLHAQCRACGAVLDLPPDLLDAVARTLADSEGFVLEPGHVALSGTCAACAVG